jgi:ubiquitin-protein ligase
VEQELKRRSRDAPYGIGIWPSDNHFDLLDAVIDGPEHSPFLGGEFLLLATMPPNVLFFCRL